MQVPNNGQLTIDDYKVANNRHEFPKSLKDAIKVVFSQEPPHIFFADIGKHGDPYKSYNYHLGYLKNADFHLGWDRSAHRSGWEGNDRALSISKIKSSGPGNFTNRKTLAFAMVSNCNRGYTDPYRMTWLNSLKDLPFLGQFRWPTLKKSIF